MADEHSQGFSEVDVPGSSVPVVSVDADDLDQAEQSEALLSYKSSGQVGDYVDPSRDQESDIAPEFGISPHPELKNPAPPKGAVGAEASDSPVVAPVEDKVKSGEEAEAASDVSASEQADVLNQHIVPDESAKASAAVSPAKASGPAHSAKS